MLLQIDQRHVEPDITVLVFAGKISLGRESQRIEMLVRDLLQQNQKKMVFDLSGVTYIDSTGLGIITFCAATAAEAGGAVRVAGPTGLTEKLLHMTKLDKIIGVYPSVDAACEALKASGAASGAPSGPAG